MKLSIVISGFQSGADIGGIVAAHDAGMVTGGFMPKGYKTEYGPRPGYAGLYGAWEHPSDLYPPRTDRNVHAADATIWFGPAGSAGYYCTRAAAEKHGRLWLEVGTEGAGPTYPADVAEWLRAHAVAKLNVAGSRESKQPGIGERVERFLSRVFRILKEG